MGRYDEHEQRGPVLHLVERDAVLRLVCERGSVNYLDVARELGFSISVANHLLKMFCSDVGEYHRGTCISYGHRCEQLLKGGEGNERREI
ncbi:MAG: hypothetical protein C0167_00410 [Nitrososphaera sp.]|nr:MAG: hypothetical protein C0167_00410 [Nitrososphaera sp.]